MRHPSFIPALAAVVVFAGACAGHRAADPTSSAADATTTHVRNANPFPVTVYLTQTGVLKHRLGVVESMSAATFEVAPSLLTGRREFQLVASPLGPRPSLVSETFMLRQGQSASWRITEAGYPGPVVGSMVAVN